MGGTFVRYTIEFRYTTGDTFQSYETTGELGISWENLEVAKEALARIMEYHKATKYNDSYEVKYGYNGKEPIDLKTLAGYSPEYSEVCIMLPLDDGTEHRHSRFWDGYFEDLHVAEIVPINDVKGEDGMKYVP
jgi:hypothetical protein